MLNIHFNGKRMEVAEGTSLAELLESHRISRRNLFVDWNDTILYGNDDLEHRLLSNGDRVSLFSMVGGG
ncbi:MAG TPA: thiamine biosynthesis protein ThiS [Lentisphaeria bacterium]|nr:thiamine biosynthesis protein ThiS [Lentisphaeria bacterium]